MQFKYLKFHILGEILLLFGVYEKIANVHLNFYCNIFVDVSCDTFV